MHFAYKQKIMFGASFLPCGDVKAPHKENVANTCLFEKPSPKMRKKEKRKEKTHLEVRVPLSRVSPLVENS